MIDCPRCHRHYTAPEYRCPDCGHTIERIHGFLAWAPDLADTRDGFNPDYFAQLAAHESRHFWFRARNRLIVRALQRHVPHLRDFMEIGCGTGYVLGGIARAFPAARLAGSELHPQGLEFAAQRLPQAELMQMDARAIPYREAWDVIGAFDVLEHIREDDAVIRAVHAALRPGGAFLLTVPQHPSLWSQMDELACHQRRYRAKDLHRQLRQAGFQIRRSSSFVTLLLPLMMLARRRARPTAPQYDPLQELQIAPWLNRCLEFVLTLERRLICAGINLPVGGSRLVLAIKPRP